MNVDELKKRIHKELFDDRYTSPPPVSEWKDQMKRMIMLRSVNIMRRHGQSEKEIIKMLVDKFLLTEEQAGEFLKNCFP